MGCALRACQGGSICSLHRKSVPSNRNTAHQAALNRQKKDVLLTMVLGPLRCGQVILSPVVAAAAIGVFSRGAR